jgi:hypothetical protein
MHSRRRQDRHGAIFERGGPAATDDALDGCGCRLAPRRRERAARASGVRVAVLVRALQVALAAKRPFVCQLPIVSDVRRTLVSRDGTAFGIASSWNRASILWRARVSRVSQLRLGKRQRRGD